ncbi:MAG TPA: hypothetical protein VEY87_08710 [Gaiellaceae bacterium]|nr:hypothetical protein [Gaiellaceae bacterium]
MDEITVSIPRERPFGAVAALVLGGVAARHELTLDVLDDLQLALETLLEREAESEDEINVELRIDEDVVDACVGPFALQSVAELEEEEGERLGLRRLLTTVVDRVQLASRGGEYWVELRKSFPAAAEVA